MMNVTQTGIIGQKGGIDKELCWITEAAHIFSKGQQTPPRVLGHAREKVGEAWTLLLFPRSLQGRAFETNLDTARSVVPNPPLLGNANRNHAVDETPIWFRGPKSPCVIVATVRPCAPTPLFTACSHYAEWEREIRVSSSLILHSMQDVVPDVVSWHDPFVRPRSKKE